MFIKLLLSCFIGYILGSVSWAVILTKKIAHEDVRKHGSGNAGATNVARVFGMGAGVMTFAADAAKTAASMLAGRLIGGEPGALIAAAACLAGHCYPVFFSFRGGKGVSVGAAIGLMLDWRLFVLLVVVFFTVFLLSKKVSACSLSCAASFPVIQYFLGVRGWELILGLFVMVTVVYMHRDNLKRLIEGTETEFKPKSGK